MAEYTTTEEVRAAFIDSYRWPDGSRLRGRSEKSEAEFDRWLASVKAEVWDQGVRHAESCPGGLSCDADKANPYRVQGMCESCGVDLRYPTAAHILDCHASMRANSSDGDL